MLLPGEDVSVHRQLFQKNDLETWRLKPGGTEKKTSQSLLGLLGCVSSFLHSISLLRFIHKLCVSLECQHDLALICHVINSASCSAMTLQFRNIPLID